MPGKHYFILNFILLYLYCICIYFIHTYILYFYTKLMTLVHVCMLSFSHILLFETPWTIACQAPLFMGFSRQEYRSGLPFSPSGNLPDLRIQPMSPVSPALLADSLPLSHLRLGWNEIKKVKSLSRVRFFVTPWTEPTRLLCPWVFPGKSTGVGCHFLLQVIFPTQESNPGLLPCRQTLYHLSHQDRLGYIFFNSSFSEM